MTPEEKVQLIHGSPTPYPAPPPGAGWVPGIPRLNIPDLHLADGSVGVNDPDRGATALPSSILYLGNSSAAASLVKVGTVRHVP